MRKWKPFSLDVDFATAEPLNPNDFTLEELAQPIPDPVSGTPFMVNQDWAISAEALADPGEYEYIVSLHHAHHLDAFYEDMESISRKPRIPRRKVGVCHRRPNSVNTHYYLTRAEALDLLKDPRVASVQRPLEHLGFPPPSTCRVINGPAFDKSLTSSSNMQNWNLLRATLTQQIAGWGQYTPAGGAGTSISQSGTVITTLTGKNVDVVVNDQNPDVLYHPEWAVNADGTGGSRQNLYNWYQLLPQVTGAAAGTYDYTANAGSHAVHVSGTCVGNTQGWASDANLYNITFAGTAPTPSGTVSMGSASFDFVRVWHQQKAKNPTTGRPNPTVCNNSWGTSLGFVGINSYYGIYYRGIVNVKPAAGWSVAQLLALGQTVQIFSGGVIGVMAEQRDSAIDAAALQCMNAGVICCTAAGNNYNYIIAAPGGVDYNNGIMLSASSYAPLQQGSSPAAVFGGTWQGANFVPMICVGAISPNTDEAKDFYSDTGPRVDVYAAGSAIQSSFDNANNGLYTGPSLDPRNPAYYLNKDAGTSMACPQVAGLLACSLQMYPDMKQIDAYNFIRQTAQVQAGGPASPTYPTVTFQQLPAATWPPANWQGSSYTQFFNLRGGSTYKASYSYDIPITGAVNPTNKYWLRPQTGQVWPRTQIRYWAA